MSEQKRSPFKEKDEVLGEGSFSTVRKAELVGREGYAIKRVTVHEGNLGRLYPDVTVARALYEAGYTRESSRLLYPIEVHQDRDFELEDMEQFFLVYPEMKGGNLFELGARNQRERINGVGYLSRELTLRAIDDIATAVDALHKVGFAHCDIAMSNVMLDEGRFFLGDLNRSAPLNSRGERRDRVYFSHLVKCLLIGSVIERSVDERFADPDAAAQAKEFILDGWGKMEDVKKTLDPVLRDNYPLGVVGVFNRFEAGMLPSFKKFAELLIDELKKNENKQ
jgi:serine/threonine protein kinase